MGTSDQMMDAVLLARQKSVLLVQVDHQLGEIHVKRFVAMALTSGTFLVTMET